MPLSTTSKQLYIVELEDPFNRIDIQFFPDEISVPREARLSSISIVGRNNNLFQYTGGEETLNLPLEFFADEVTEVYTRVNWLKSLTMKDGNNKPFRNVKLVFGDLFKNEVWVVKSVSPVFSMFDEEINLLPLRAKVEIQLILDPVTNMLLDDMRNRYVPSATMADNNQGGIIA